MFSNSKGNKKVTKFTKIVAVMMSLVMFTLLTGAVIDRQSKQVSLVIVDAFDGSETTKELFTRQNNVEGFIKENEIEVGEFDRFGMLPEDKLYNGARVVLRRGRKFNVNIDGGVQSVVTTKKTLSEAFLENGIAIGTMDRVEPTISSNVISDMSVNVYRVSFFEYMEQQEIPFTSTEVLDNGLLKGTSEVRVKGINGLKNVSYKIKTENGAEVERIVTGETVTRETVNQVVAIGNMEKPVVTKQGKPLSYSKKMTVTATAYTARSGAKTASGRVAQYGVIAVDPKVIPLGTKLYVESTDDGVNWTYGYCVAGDTGGAIKGKIIDLFYNSEGQCLQFGRRSATVYVLD